MTQIKTPAAFIRGGTSKGLFFVEDDLPTGTKERDRLFLAALGSPDTYGRQLDGMGGGISSLSKIVIVAPSRRDGVDIDYLFGQVAVKDARVDYAANCGNLTSAVGPFAVDQGLLPAPNDGMVTVRLFNRNTNKRIDAAFSVHDGHAAVAGNFALTGVAGTGAPVQLTFHDPGGASTGKLLPSGRTTDTLFVPGLGNIPASLVDATTACVFVPDAAVGLSAAELPEALDQRDGGQALKALELVRRAAAEVIGLDPDTASVPKIGIVGGPTAAVTLDGHTLPAETMSLNARMISMGNTHRALPLTGALCLAVAARLPGSIVKALRPEAQAGALQIGTPSGILALDATVHTEPMLHAASVQVIRTQRRLMDGHVLTPLQAVAA